MIIKGIFKKSRKLGISLLENGKEFGSKRFDAEKIGIKKKWRSNYGIQNIEKNKFRYLYGIKEKQLRRMFEESRKKGGDIVDEMIIMAESRIDNIVFRSGIAKTRRAARQLVSHGFFILENKGKLKIIKSPSYKMKLEEDILFPKNKEKKRIIAKNIVDIEKNKMSHLSIDKDKISVKIKEKIDENFLDIIKKKIQISKIIEWYN